MILLSLSSCWSRRAALSRTTPRTSCSCQITRTTRTTASALSAELDWTTSHKHSCPGMVLERASLHSWSGCWCPANQKTHRGQLGWRLQLHSEPRTQSSSTPWREAARVYHRWRARACHGCWDIAIRSDRADDHPGAWAPSVWLGARTDSTSKDGYSCGDCGGYEKSRPCRHHWGWAHTGLSTWIRKYSSLNLHQNCRIGNISPPTSPSHRLS